MPFTLAHPAAVLPLRRYCPRFLSFPALVAGSLSPDAGYCFEQWKLDGFSHSFIGSFAFCLPVGLVLLAGFYGLKRPMSRLVASPSTPLLHHSTTPSLRFPNPLSVLISLLVGAWTHLVWDSFTNQNGWFVLRLPFLQSAVAEVPGHQVRVCHLLWYGCSCAGVAWLCLAYENWRQTAATVASPGPAPRNWWKAAVAGALVLPIGATHHLVRGLAGLVLVGLFSALLVAAIALTSHRAARPARG